MLGPVRPLCEDAWPHLLDDKNIKNSWRENPVIPVIPTEAPELTMQKRNIVMQGRRDNMRKGTELSTSRLHAEDQLKPVLYYCGVNFEKWHSNSVLEDHTAKIFYALLLFFLSIIRSFKQGRDMISLRFRKITLMVKWKMGWRGERWKRYNEVMIIVKTKNDEWLNRSSGRRNGKEGRDTGNI